MTRRRSPVKTLFKVESIEKNSVVIIKEGSALDTPQQMKRLANEMIQRDLGDVLVLKLASLDDFHVLSEAQMNRLGWWKKEGENERPD